jgi:hypothetical protein
MRGPLEHAAQCPESSDQRVSGGLEISTMKPFGSRTQETVCPYGFATGPYHALAPASIAAR